MSSALAFWGSDPTNLEGKARQAFRGGFLGVSTLGWSTLVQIVEASQADRARLVEALAQRLTDDFGAPDMEAAQTAAEDEVAFVENLCNEPQATLISVQRTYENGTVHETFSTLEPREGPKPSARLFLPRSGRRGRRAA